MEVWPRSPGVGWGGVVGLPSQEGFPLDSLAVSPTHEKAPLSTPIPHSSYHH